MATKPAYPVAGSLSPQNLPAEGLAYEILVTFGVFLPLGLQNPGSRPQGFESQDGTNPAGPVCHFLLE